MGFELKKGARGAWHGTRLSQRQRASAAFGETKSERVAASFEHFCAHVVAKFA